ncbi:hypothetical protein BC938DRAFT_483123 [Jimgerdemannia flammicorona]|uniref:Uncharacterized protein n=1 Tax=Jimgerdemannia flammicorona TaxID=994334 RepID=A0A433QCL6_9FUNG|nr:hypothetical protein BC938DRAFT_483123 [Jimgerdemannia flammicorona]
MSTRTFHCLACHCHLIDPRTPAYLTPCCNRWVCDACVSRNPRLLQYCLYYQDPRRWIGEDLEELSETDNHRPPTHEPPLSRQRPPRPSSPPDPFL